MAKGTPKGREAAMATGEILVATALAGLASVVVQLGGAGAYAAFVVLAAAAVALLVLAGRSLHRARAPR
jgi:hypothetical protein